MPYTRRTGGSKEFHYTKDDMRRIESEDTDSTREFKKVLREWREKKKRGKKPKYKDYVKPRKHKKHHHKSIYQKAIEQVREEQRGKKRYKKHIPNKILKFLIVLVLLITGILYFTFSNEIEVVTEEIPKVKTVFYNETLTNKISFKEYLDDVYEADEKNVTLKALLKRYIKALGGGSGVYTESIVDDYDNTIDIMNIDNELKKSFPHLGTTKEVYEVNGIFKRKYKTLHIKVETILPSERDPAGQVQKKRVINYKENVERNVKKPKYPLIRNLVFNLIGKEIKCEDETLLNNCSDNKPFYCTLEGLAKKPTKCGCPKGERVYKAECIKEVKCSDGTYEPECSKNKPKQCVNGKLVDNANLCGCPEDYKKVGDSCEKIMRCSDRTIYGECSNDKPLYCEDGKLISYPKKCGCERGYTMWEDKCITTEKANEFKEEERRLKKGKEVIDYINELRKEYGKRAIEYDERVHRLAIARAKDMDIYGYLDHTNPDTGTCPDSMKTDFGLSSYEYVAENAFGVYGGYYSADEIDAVNSWMSSRGHRYNLLYNNHIAGAVGCYNGMCTFLGLNGDRFGEGCYTAAEGNAFWESASKQPGEIY